MNESIAHLVAKGKLLPEGEGQWGIPELSRWKLGNTITYMVEENEGGTFSIIEDDRYNGPRYVLIGDADQVASWIEEHAGE